MQKLKSIKQFQIENADAVLTNMELNYGGKSVESLTHVDSSTLTEWNCSDVSRQMFWDGTSCSDPFLLPQMTEQP